ncbi:cell division regulator GpsB [Brochothrix campestris]|uniref:Cell cycle protein GpsB n=1 Tax=Brochothrix campestris FSL F6-1037 TaxID=1265861 RepID=W7CN10_9LIST|nr:cell division regulator GpsB [Brochothrix campestris]EUJ38065.1 hypothetical protein BCAMP_09410 [Brochothrix campestris FSL F6-1037]
MTMENLNLTAQEILDKEFKTGMRGYSAEEVDQFLDLVIKDYNTYNAEIKQLQAAVMRLEQMVSTTVSEQEAPKEQVVENQGTSNYDILKRLSNLERHVFGNKMND